MSVLVGLMLVGSLLCAAPPDLWRSETLPAAGLAARFAELDQLSGGLPGPVRATIYFQKLLLQIRSGSPATSWRSELEKAAQEHGDGPATVALRELAKAWLARLAMSEIDGVLRKYYRQHVRFPDSLAEVHDRIPENVRRDPWDEPWLYEPSAPRGFAALAKQRYQLGPTRHPQLSTLERAVKSSSTVPAWKIIGRDVGGHRAIEIHGADGQSAVVQPGGRFAEATLIHIADGWALFADTERLFTVSF